MPAQRSEFMLEAMPVDLKWEVATRLWCAYYVGAEEYDRRVCSGTSPRTGEALPLNAEESRLITAHARREQKLLLEKASSYDIPQKTLQEARRVVCQWSLQQQREAR